MRLFLLISLCALASCKTTRTVTSGPRSVSEGSSDYNPQAEAANELAGRQAAASGVVGQFGSGGDAFNRRFGTFDPHGYGEDGLNAMSEQMFGGNTRTQEMKSYTQTRDFLAKRYTNTRELGQKESPSRGLMSWLGGRKANAEKPAAGTAREYYDSGRVLANKTSHSDGRTVRERAAHDAERMASTRDFLPAKKVLDQGADAPKIIGEGDKRTNDAVLHLIKSRPRDNPATEADIRALLGKTTPAAAP